MNQTEQLNNRFRSLFRDGKLVHVHVSKWGMGVPLREADLGLEAQPEAEQEKKEAVPTFVSLGRKWLFKPEVRNKFGRIEGQARAYLLNNSHVFPIASAHFVPKKKLVEVINHLSELQTEYETAVNDFVTNYDKYKQDMLDAHPEHKDILENCYPPVDKVRNKFSFSVSSFEIAFPEELKQVGLVEIQAQNEAIDEAKGKYEAQMAKQYQQSVQQMQEFIKESALALRKEVVTLFETVTKKIVNKEVISATNIKSIKEMITGFDSMDFFDDAEVKKKLAAVKALVESGKDFKDDNEARAQLHSLVTSAIETANSMSDIDQVTGGYIRKLDLDLG